MLIGLNRDISPGALMWPAALIVWGPGSVTSAHAHHCVQLILALDGVMRVRESPHAPWRTCSAVFVPPDSEHEIDANGVPVLIGFIDPQSALGVALADRARDGLTCVPDVEVAEWRSVLGEPSTLEQAQVERWIRGALLRESRPEPIHPRVARVLDVLRDQPLDAQHVLLGRLAKIAGLSPSRFAHLFRESVGIPLRPYLLWLRLQRATGALATGQTVTEAAYEAGFSDAAHLTRTFRRMLGSTPRELIRRAPATRELRMAAVRMSADRA